MNEHFRLFNNENQIDDDNAKVKDFLSFNDDQRLILNVGGAKHEVKIRTLKRIPNSRLGQLIRVKAEKELLSICDDYNLDELEFYFDRDPTLFNCILKHYRLGKIHIRDDLCPSVLEHELIYWKIESPKLDFCCGDRFFDKKKELGETILYYRKIEKDVKIKLAEQSKINSKKFSQLWNVVENSFEKNSTNLAKVICNSKNSKIRNFIRE